MPLPRISKETRRLVIEELNSYSGEPEYCGEMLRKLGVEEDGSGGGQNPVIADFLYRIFEFYKGDPKLTTWMVTFGFLVYRMVEVTIGEKGMPKIGEHVGAPLQKEFFDNIRTYGQSLARRLQTENPEVLLTCVDITWTLFTSDDRKERRIAAMTLESGLMVYRFIESQYESDEMTKSFIKP